MDEEPVNRRWITPAQWLAARALSEGAHPTRKRVAALLGCDDSAVYARASLEGWKRLDFRSSQVRALHDEMIDLAAGGSGQAAAGDGDEDGDEAGDATDFAVLAAAVDSAGEGDGGAGDGDEGGCVPERGGNPAAMLASASRFVSRQLARLMARADRRGGRLDKREIDGLAALARMMERWESLATERAREEVTESDDEIAELLAKIDARIKERARFEAARLVADGHRPGAGPPRA